jgi:uncharacterized protein DUF5946
MPVSQCPECGAVYPDETDSCAARFAMLLALDHSRREPWGSRHGVAFAAFALQHPTAYAASVDRAWAMLHRIYVAGVPAAEVIARLRACRGELPAEWRPPPRPPRPARAPRVTIADLGDFAPETYPAELDAWCRASIAAWT